jgi:hypothetical protein
VSFYDQYRLFGADMMIKCMDVPGINDSSGTLSKKTIEEWIKLGLAGLGCQQINAFLLFQSSAEADIQLKKVIEIVETIFGPSILSSML